MSATFLFTESSPNVGGQELQLMQQMRQLQAAGHRAVLACRAGGRVEQQARAQGLEVISVRFRNSLHLPSILRLRAWMACNRPLAAICHSGHDSNILALAARLLRRRPRLIRSRTYQPGKPSAWSYNLLVDATMLPSAYMKRCLLENRDIIADKLHVVYPGIDFAALDSAAQLPLAPALQAWLERAPGPLLVHAAMLRAEKGHMTLLAAISLLRARWPTLRYVIAGEGPEQERIAAEIARLGLQQQVLLAGVVNPVAALLRRASFVVMPSSYEPLGMSQIEALGLGVPVIASRTGGIPETISDGQTGDLVAPDQAQAWAEAIARGLDHYPERQAWARAGRQDVRQRFAPAHNLGQLLALAGCSPAETQA
jgi:glycosyltransferase involved in cell wall biosynthesis